MDKEREIEGIVEAMYAICDDCNDCPYEKYGYLACEEHQKAERIYEAGYRKADEVRKETVEEILQTVWDRLGDGAENDKIILSLFAKYGVEVDE